MSKSILIEAFLRDHHMGEEKAVRSKDLEALFKISERTLRRCIKKLREEEVPICSSNAGYFYARNQEEVKRSAAFLGNMSDSVSNTRMSLLSSRAPNIYGKYVIVIFPGDSI